METRHGRITASKAGGTAGKGSKTYKLSLPSSWVSRMGISRDGGDVIITFDGDTVMISPQQSMEQYRISRHSKGHDLLEIRYYSGDVLCTLIYADRTVRDLRAENYTDNLVKTAFGINTFPSWEDLDDFLEERCVPRERAGLREYLNALGLYEYEPIEIIQKTKGRMAEDNQWMEIKNI